MDRVRLFRTEMLRTALDTLFPRSCPGCAVTLYNHTAQLCNDCQDLLKLATATPACPRCAHSIGPFGVHDGRCHACKTESRQIDAVSRVGAYAAPLAQLIRRFKYRGCDELDQLLGDALADVARAASWFAAADAIAFVPTHWRHSIRRPFYAPKILCRCVASVTGLPTITVIRRVAGGTHQMNVPLARRWTNIRGKFAIIPGTQIEGARIVVLDDVSTSGATLNECARVLKRAGADHVAGLVLSRVDTKSNTVPNT